MWVLNDVLNFHQSFSKILPIFDIFLYERLNDMLCSLVAIMFNKVVEHEFIYIEKMPINRLNVTLS